MADKELLSKMLDNLIDGNADQAQVEFHGYLKDKMQEIIAPAALPDVPLVQPKAK